MTFGCKKENRDNIYIRGFPEIKKLSGYSVKEIKLYGKGIRVNVIDTFLIIQKREEKFIQIYSTNTHILLSETGLRGRGPGEFVSPYLLNQSELDSSNNSPIFYIYDFTRRRISRINILDILKNDYHVIKQETIPNINSDITYFYFKNDTTFIATPDYGGRFIIYNYNAKEKKIIPFIPKLGFSTHGIDLGQIYRNACCVNSEKGILAAAPLWLGQIDFFDFNGNYIKSTILESSRYLKKELSKERKLINPKYYISELIAKNNLIFALNYDTNYSDYTNKTIKNFKIQVFSWEGIAVKEYILDHRFIRSFAIDLFHKRIYGYCPDELEYPIIIYDINE